MKTSLMIVATALFGLGANAYAEERPCMADAARLCPNIEPGGGAQMECLKAHKDELSPACKKKMMQTKIKHEEQKQELRGQKIQLWLEPNDPASGGPKSAGGPKQRIHKVEAFERVHAVSPEAIIKRADHLLIVFRPDLAAGSMLPEVPERTSIL